MRVMDFSSWQSIVLTIGGLALVTLIGVGVRLIAMMTIQQRRERMNRQINERLRTLIAAYKTLGGSFTGDLAVNPAHLRDQRPPPRAWRTQASLVARILQGRTARGAFAMRSSQRCPTFCCSAPTNMFVWRSRPRSNWSPVGVCTRSSLS